MTIKQRLICASFAAILCICFAWFVAWIGGVHPFTRDAALFAFLGGAGAAFIFVAMFGVSEP